ncbi:MAG: UDP-glucose 4-epimerase GalE [Caldilinea sp.]|nr:UDP-glucose 4-epimerase GalE [Caldilineaceae bacterium]MCB9120706.1 UDP-glucose 4-epimerase GalE [Caldilineaceae bacterium]MCO5210103.1 UDP-glucose 4-epimerase GalE [Caldilinea sp.]MCW5843435.1 UDP-glucose 4-epimerase GalE [Caldilinea sp.]
MKVLVTGGAGYIGSITVEQLIKGGEEVVVFDNLYQGHRDAVHPDAAFVQGDLKDRAAIDAALAAHKPDAIMHFASYTLVGESMQHPFMYLGDNITNGLNLLQSAHEHGVKKFILSSTANLFDKPERMPIDENERIVPGSPYGESKNILERMLYWLDVTQGMRYACLRYFNACGASEERGEDHTPETHIIPLILQVALGQRADFAIFGDDYPTPDGTCVRDYVHVVDLAQAHILALRALDDGSRTYNLGSGRGFSVKEVIDMAREVTGRPIPTRVVARRPGDPAVLVASSDKIRRELGWAPKYPDLRTIMEMAWNWHLSNPTGYAK